MRSTEFVSGLLIVAAGFARAVDQQRPRGVGPEFAKFYQRSGEFTCLSNPSIKLSAGQVNDEYCDCPDGSDEPGTSACAHLSLLSPQTLANIQGEQLNITAALPGFYCANKGHNPAYIPFTLVNDGICDYDVCCDGSDEWEHAGGVKCEDRCNAIGKEWKKQDQARQKSRAAALKRRQDLAKEAVKLKQELKNKYNEVLTAIEAAEIKVKQLEVEKDEIEKKEKRRVVKDAGKGGKTGVLAGLAKGKIQELQNAVINTRADRDSYRNRVIELEEILKTFKKEYNPNFNDEGVKRAVKAWEDYLTDVETDEDEGNVDDDFAHLTEEDGIPWAEFEEDHSESDTDVLYKLEEYLPPSVRAWVDSKLRDLQLFLIENGIIAGSNNVHATTDSAAVSNAIVRLHSAKDDLNAQNKSKKELEGDLDRDFGPDDVWRALKGQCASLESGEYTYEVCWMDQVTQKSKKGGSHGMGNFERFDTTVVNEDDRADGKGLGSGKRVTMLYDNGAHCWNGPNRRTTVVLACSEKEEVWKVSEEEKCVYRIEAGNPAVCDGEPNSTTGEGKKDEL